MYQRFVDTKYYTLVNMSEQAQAPAVLIVLQMQEKNKQKQKHTIIAPNERIAVCGF